MMVCGKWYMAGGESEPEHHLQPAAYHIPMLSPTNHFPILRARSHFPHLRPTTFHMPKVVNDHSGNTQTSSLG
jgi:hypothetical protein